MLVSILEYDSYLGRVLTGRILSGTARLNMPVKSLTHDGETIEESRLTKLNAFRGIERVPVELAEAGDIIAVAGLGETTVAHTICAPEVTTPIAANPIDPPTLAMNFQVNDSPLAGREGDKLTSRVLGARLKREAEGNVAIRVRDTDSTDVFEVSGRGELQLGVLIETMRREGFELAVSRPRVLYKIDEHGKRLEPIEEVVIEVDDAYTGAVVEALSERRAEMTNMRPSGVGRTRLDFLAPTRGLIGYLGQFLNDTRGTGVMNRLFHGYAPFKGPVAGRRNGVLISTASGRAVPYGLWYIEERGQLFIPPGVDVYTGMIIGENAKPEDLAVNPMREKQLTNIRTTSKDEAVRLTTPRTLTLEQSMSYIKDDELVEVTPKSIRLRKRLLDPNERKRAARAAAAEGEAA
jgi:GTP-binding protein